MSSRQCRCARRLGAAAGGAAARRGIQQAEANSPGNAIDQATEILKNRGDQPRQKQNRLDLHGGRCRQREPLEGSGRSVLAWQSIVSDVKEGRLNLDSTRASRPARAWTMPRTPSTA